MAVGAHDDQVTPGLGRGVDQDFADWQILDVDILGFDLEAVARQVCSNVGCRRAVFQIGCHDQNLVGRREEWERIGCGPGGFAASVPGKRDFLPITG